MKTFQVRVREFMSLCQKYEKRVSKFSFLSHTLEFKSELYHYTYIIFFEKHLSQLYWIELTGF